MWQFLNSAFCLWLLTSVVGGVGVWGFERYIDQRNRTQGLIDKGKRMDLEFEGRIAQCASWVDGIVENIAGSRDKAEFRRCVTNEYLHRSILSLGSVPARTGEISTNSTKYRKCPEMFRLLPIFSEFSGTSLLGLYAERIVIEETLFPGKERRDSKDGPTYILRDPIAAKAIASWENAMNPFLTPDAITGIEIGSNDQLLYARFHENMTNYFYSSPRQKTIFNYGDCFRC